MASKTYKILFVEDDEDVRDIVEQSLGRDPAFKLVTCSSGEEALKALSGRVEYFDLGLFNVRLPGISGPELLRALREMPGFSQLRVIFLTASVLEPHVQRYEEQGALAVIGKPFDADTLRAQIMDVLVAAE